MPAKRNNKTYLAFWGPHGLYNWLDAKRRKNSTSVSREILAILLPIWRAEKESKRDKAA